MIIKSVNVILMCFMRLRGCIFRRLRVPAGAERRRNTVRRKAETTAARGRAFPRLNSYRKTTIMAIMGKASIDRRGLVSRHDPVYGGNVSESREAPLSVGNGAFCFTADFTGLQTFAEERAAFPLCTMAEWGWHRYADAPADDSGLRLEPFDTWSRNVGYAVSDAGQEALFKGLRHNAHKFNLARIGFDTGSFVWVPVRQRLSLWEGVLYSLFSLNGEKVAVETFAAPDEDTLHVRVISPLVRTGTLKAVIAFPYGSHQKAAGTFAAPHLHTTSIVQNRMEHDRRLVLRRVMDTTVYGVTVTLGEGMSVSFDGSHTLTLAGGAAGVFTFAVRFETGGPALSNGGRNGAYNGVSENTPGESRRNLSGLSDLSGFTEARAACTAFWARYWNEGGAVDLSGSTDSRAGELERRIVLSQYLTAIQSRGALIPAETGLTMNSWYGKFHLEMHYWHTGHFALWGRAAELKKSLALYKRFLPRAREIAASQGYRGARWPKMCDDTGYNTPSSIAVLLVWQQPHPLFLAELCYRANPFDKETLLHEYRDVIAETAAFMFDFLHWDGGRYVLGPPLIPVQERFDPRAVLNPAFETAYFRWGLRQANIWLTRLGESPRTDWALAASKLAPPAVKDGLYLAHEHCPETFTRQLFLTDHPSMLMMKGVLPGGSAEFPIDDTVMNATLDRVLGDWDRQSLWGWDFPMMAMTACRLGRREDAVRLLLLGSPKNTYLSNGHNQQTGSDDLPLYLPGNGGLLMATAMMTAGFDGSGPLPGFPSDGHWQVRYEDILCAI